MAVVTRSTRRALLEAQADTPYSTPDTITLAFLSLPAELRLEIYSYMAISHVDTLESYAGLYLSSKAILEEMKVECARLLKAHLEDIASTWPAETGLTLDWAGTIPTTSHVTLNVPWPYFIGSGTSVRDPISDSHCPVIFDKFSRCISLPLT